ncbi:MAG: cyclic nucleotide-binding domain-containing protein [Leptospiraceae bacterium]|nr:cyclic nucleotide-binding domain-containing protein [Leptospiraceae bacterium]MCP5512924.1 cyclic nucleotide-binding domain-containing protein [Leptospiraceae bacterium]
MIDFKLLTTQKLPIQIEELQFCVYSKDQLIREKIQKTVSLLNLNQFKLKYSFFTNLDESIEFITYNQKSKILFLDYNQSYERDSIQRRIIEIHNDPWLHGTLIVILANQLTSKEFEELLNYGVIDIISSKDLLEKSNLLLRIISSIYNKLRFNQFSQNNSIIKNGRIRIKSDLNLIPDVCDLLISYSYQIGIRNLKQLSKIYLTLFEMISNAIEHGNCGIGFYKKSELIKKNINLSTYISEMNQNPDIASKRVEIKYELQTQIARFQISDQGEGFDVRKTIQLEQIKDLNRVNGRGILMSTKLVDSLQYNSIGNKVRFSLKNPQEFVPKNSPIFDFSNEKELVLKEGEILIREDTDADFLYFIISGKLGVYKNNRLIATLNHEDIFVGEMSFLEQTQRTGTVIALSQSKVLPISQRGFIDMLKTYPYAGVVLARLLSKRLIRRNLSD